MKVACLRKNLIRGLGASGGDIPSRTAMDMLRNVLIDPWETRLKISGTNLETTITPWTEAQGAYSRVRPRPGVRTPGRGRTAARRGTQRPAYRATPVPATRGRESGPFASQRLPNRCAGRQRPTVPATGPRSRVSNPLRVTPIHTL